MSNAERVSYQMFVDALTGSDMQHPFMISEYFYEMDLPNRNEPEEIAKVQALNADKTRFLLRYLDEFWKPSDV